MTKRLVIVASQRALVDERRRAERDGLDVREGWTQDSRVVSAGVVGDANDAAEALLAAVWGAGVLIHATASQEIVARLVEDLGRLGAVELRLSGTVSTPKLTHEEQTLLEFLAEGVALGEAAERLHVSRRTADRRLASARRKLGAGTTAEALVAFTRL